MSTELEPIIQLFLNASNHLSEIERLKFGAFLAPEYLTPYLETLKPENRPRFIERRSKPYFAEEIRMPHEVVWEKHQAFSFQLKSFKPEEQTEAIVTFLSEQPFQNFLLILGQRFTEGSVCDVKALPPSSPHLLELALRPYNTEIKVGVRAWEKHVGRSKDPFWGEITGTPSEKENHASQLIKSIIDTPTWWNTFEHYKHGVIYELREENGHGLRWSLEKNMFIGFVEPFITVL